ncbi:MAG: NAD-dependent epimerase/dehydratase family protein [Myxococcota bacterium]
MLDGETVLVTGAAGFLGAWVVRAVEAAGGRALPTCRDVTNAWRLEGVSARPRRLDVRDSASIESVFAEERPLHVIHCAAAGVDPRYRDAALELDVNLHGSLRLIEAAARRGVERFLHIGSCFEYAGRLGRICEDGALVPTGSYGASKAAATIVMRERALHFGLSLVAVRPFALWGPGEGLHRLVPQVLAACRERKPLALTLCEVVRDYSYVEDVAHSLVSLLRARLPEPVLTVNLGSGEPRRLRDFVLEIARELEGEAWLRFGELPARSHEPRSLVACTCRLVDLIGERIQTPLVEGLRRMEGLEWARAWAVGPGR